MTPMTSSDGASPTSAASKDVQGIIEAATDYTEGWFTADAGRMARALHPDLVKRTISEDPETGAGRVEPTLTRNRMVELTRDGGERDRPDDEKRFEIEVLDVFQRIAAVMVRSYPYVDYLHLAKLDGRWQIINCLYEVRVDG